jgi:hypothetical protein
MPATTIHIFLIEGDPTGLKTAEIDNWTGQALVIPRNKLQDAQNRPEISKPSVYFLIGKNEEDDNKPLVYVGEAGNFWTRVCQHSEKDFWQTAIAFSSKDSNFTKIHAGYLENVCHELALKAGRCALQNSTQPTKHQLPEREVAAQAVFLENLKILLASLGYSFLEPIISKDAKDAENPLFYNEGKGALATGRISNEGFIVYQGSTAVRETEYSKSAQEKNPKMIKRLLDNGYIAVLDDKYYTFVKDCLFNTPSAASDIIQGNSSNGWLKWRTKEGKTLSDIYRDR